MVTNHLAGTDGWSRYSVDIVSELQAQGHTVRVVAADCVAFVGQCTGVLSSALSYLAHPLRVYKGAKAVQKIVDSFTPDVVHVMVEPYMHMLPFLRLGNARSVVTVHGTYADMSVLVSNRLHRWCSRWLSRRALRTADAIVTVSSYTAEYLFGRWEELGEELVAKTTVVHNAIDMASVPAISERDEDTAIARLLFVGMVKPRKGVKEALAGLHYYKQHVSDKFVYTIVGSVDEKDPYYLTLQELIERYGLQDQVMFTGRVSESALDAYYAKADAFVMPTINDHSGTMFEGFGLVYLQANARGLACIGSNDCGAREAIVDGKTGYLVDSANPEAVARAIQQIVQERDIAAADCIAWAREHDVSVKVQELLAAYQKT